MILAFALLIFTSAGNTILWAQKDKRTAYAGHQLWQVDIQNVTFTSDFEEKLAGIEDVWHRCDNNIDFLLNGNETEYWNKFLESQNISYKVLLVDVQRAIAKEGLTRKYVGWRRGGKINWTSHPNLNDINNYLKSVAAVGGSFCTLQSIGKTAHKKDIQMLKLSMGNSSNAAFLIEAGMHGREWVSVLAALHFIEQIAWNFTQQPDYIKNKDWYIIPVSNPDGYEYSMSKDRLWRKNRRRMSGPCDGVDLNRNFDFNWGKRDTSADTCSVMYCGPVPFSEEESRAIRDLIKSRHFKGYVGIHSYGSAVLVPWMFDGKPTFDKAVHTKVAKEMVMAMRPVANEHFRAGTVSNVHFKKNSGSALDWIYSTAVQHTYLVETRGERIGQFMLEANQLEPAVREVTAGLLKMAEVVV